MKNKGAQSWEIGIVENTSGYTTNTRPGPARKHTHNITLMDTEKDDTSSFANMNN